MKKTALIAIFLLQTSIANAQSWKLPLEVNDTNTEVKFDVDTTWHVVHGTLSKISGKIEQSDASNPLAVTSEITFPVKSFDTGWGLRNDSLHEHMKVDKFPNATLKTTAIEGSCTPDKLPCDAKLKGTLTICDVTKDILVDIKIEKKDANYKVSGKYAFKWAEYNIDDPSIIAAKVEPTVEVKYSVVLPGQ